MTEDRPVERRCVYTVLVGGYEKLLEQHIAARSDIDLICFTDDRDATSASWQIRRLDPALPQDPNRSSRRPKILAHEYLPEYDVSLYIDNTVLLTVDPNGLFDRFLPLGVSMAAFEHDFRDSILDEFEQVVLQGKEAAWVRDEQLRHYQEVDPECLALRPVWGAFLLRRHHDPMVKAAMTTWWENVLRYSRRDQLSLRLAARSAALEISLIHLDNHVSEIHEWPRSAHRNPARAAALPPGPEGELVQLRAVIDTQAAELDKVRADAAVLSERIAELTTSVAARDETAAERSGELQKQTAALVFTEQMIAQYRTRLAVVEADRDRWAARTRELEKSTSWRLTSPVRKFRARTEQWVRRIHGRRKADPSP